MENNKLSFNPWRCGSTKTRISQNSTPNHRRSQWLQDTLSDLDEKTKAIVTFVKQDDGDSFAQRAETYYRNRPELINMVKELHRSYCSLAERFVQLGSEATRIRPQSRPSDWTADSFLHSNYKHKRSSEGSSRSSGDSELDVSDSYPESTVEDPELDCNSCKPTVIDAAMVETKLETCNKDQRKGNLEQQFESSVVILDVEVVNKQINGVASDEDSHVVSNMSKCFDREETWADLKLQVSKLMADNLQQQCELIRRNNEKREAIKELWFQLEKLTEENNALQNCLKCSKVITKRNQSQCSKLKTVILDKLLR